MRGTYKKMVKSVLLGSIFILTCACTDKHTTKTQEKTDIEQENEQRPETESEPINEAEKEDKMNKPEEELLWRFETGKRILSSPILVNNVLIFGSNDGYLYAVNAEDGTLVWSYEVGEPIQSRPLEISGIVYSFGGDIFVALDTLTGEEIWRNDKSDDKPNRNDSWDYHDASPVADDKNVYFGSSTGTVYGFNLTNGKLDWEMKAEDAGAIHSTPVISDGILYYADWKGCLRAVSIEKKEILWEVKWGQAFQSEIVLQDGYLYLGGRNMKFSKIHAEDGEVVWEYKDAAGSWITGTPVLSEGLIYVSTSDVKRVYAFNDSDGAVEAKYVIYMNSFTKTYVNQDYVIVSSGDAYSTPGTGKIQVYNKEDARKTVWEYKLDTGGVFTDPIVEGNVIYFGCSDGYFYAVKGSF